MRVRILEVNGIKESLTYEEMSDIRVFFGREAGICYMADSYESESVSRADKAEKRFKRSALSGHHSVADHIRISLLIEGMPKILAMGIESLSDYGASEKSGRYTELSGTSKIEQEKYNKWKDIIKSEIMELAVGFTQSEAEKLAMENARLMVSCFCPTTLGYSTSLKQINYIIDWCSNFEQRCKEDGVWDGFTEKLSESMIEFKNELINCNLYIDELRDMKGRGFDFFAYQTGAIKLGEEPREIYGDVYSVTNMLTIPAAAQLNRHRTLDHMMLLNSTGEKRYFVPYILLDTEYEKEWLKDIREVAKSIGEPVNGTLIGLNEAGTVGNFLLKCSERLCGRTQIEACIATSGVLKRLHKSKEVIAYRRKMEDFIDADGTVRTKCDVYGCNEGCRFKSGAAGGVFNRLI